MAWKSKSLDGGLCFELGIPTEVFYPDMDHLGKIAYAKLICSKCLIQEQCRNDAIERREDYGIWGGTTPEERSTIRVRQVLLVNASQRNKQREPEHPIDVDLSFLSYTSDQESHNQEVLYSDFVQRLASRVAGIEVSTLQSPAELSWDHSQKNLFSHLLVELTNLRKRLNLHQRDNLEFPEELDHESDQTEEHESSDSRQPESDPILLFFRDQFRVA